MYRGARVLGGFVFVFFVYVLASNSNREQLLLSQTLSAVSQQQSLPETEVDVSDRETFLDNWSSVQTSRLSNVSRVCALMDAGSESWGDNDYNTGGDGFVCDPDLRVAYCHVPKAASTWWLAVFARAYGLKEENITHLIKHKRLHNTMLHDSLKPNELFDGVFKFVFVRHPLQRLASAYVNKFVEARERGFVKDLNKFLRKHGRTPAITFPNLVDFVLHEWKNKVVSYGTFHWIPYHNLCNLCHTKFNMIGKLETMSSDLLYLTLKFPHLRPFVEPSRKNTASAAAAGLSTKELLGQLNPGQLNRLCLMYRRDLDMFGYDCLPPA